MSKKQSEWKCPATGLAYLATIQQRHQAEFQQALAALAKDAGVPEGVNAELDADQQVFRLREEGDSDGSEG